MIREKHRADGAAGSLALEAQDEDLAGDFGGTREPCFFHAGAGFLQVRSTRIGQQDHSPAGADILEAADQGVDHLPFVDQVAAEDDVEGLPDRGTTPVHADVGNVGEPVGVGVLAEQQAVVGVVVACRDGGAQLGSRQGRQTQAAAEFEDASARPEIRQLRHPVGQSEGGRPDLGVIRDHVGIIRGQFDVVLQDLVEIRHFVDSHVELSDGQGSAPGGEGKVPFSRHLSPHLFRWAWSRFVHGILSAARRAAVRRRTRPQRCGWLGPCQALFPDPSPIAMVRVRVTVLLFTNSDIIPLWEISESMGVRIAATGFYLPARRVGNEELARTVDTSDEWIFSHTGISARHIAAADERTSDLAYHAARRALARAGVEAADLGLIIVATSTPDFASMPATACIVQAKLGACNAGAFDMGSACSGFVYALAAGQALLAGTDRPVLVIGAEVMSRLIDWSDRNTCVLFGDGAGAAVLESCDQEGIVDSILRADGSGLEALTCGRGFYRGHPESDGAFLSMQGRAVFNFAVRALVEVVHALLERNGLVLGELDFIIPHQANSRILQAAAKRLDIPSERFVNCISDVANTSAASIPIALSGLEGEGRLQRGQKVITVGFGSGLSYGGNYLIW